MKKIVDERINRETNALAANAFWVMLLLQAGVLAAKLALGAPLTLCILDIAVVAAGLIGVIVLRSVKGLWGVKDEVLREIEKEGIAKLFSVLFWMLIMGEFLLVFMDEEHILWYAPYVLVWMIPALMIVVPATHRGLLVWGGKKAEEDGKARLLKGTIVGAVFFGIIMGGPACFQDGAFQPAGLVEVIAMGAFWGLLYYLMVSWMVRRSEKAANKAVKAAEGANGDEE